MNPEHQLTQYIASWAASPFAKIDLAPWHIVQQAEDLVRQAFADLGSEYEITSEFAVHKSSIIEVGVVLRGPGIVGPNCFVASGAYLSGGIYLGGGCIIGPSSELKTSFMFPGSKLAHLNSVGDSLVGSGVNTEAGAIIANYRNELHDKAIRIAHKGEIIETGVTKFGALIGDNARIGANAVVAPGALLEPGSKVGRLQLLDQYPY